jgi:hypothetical protein
MLIIDVFKARRRLEIENLFLRHQLEACACPYRKLKTADRDRESVDTRCQ